MVRRKKEWQDITKNLLAPMLNGDKVLMIIQKIWMMYRLESAKVHNNMFVDLVPPIP